MNSPILSFYLLTNRIEYELEFIFIEYELEFIFPHRNSTILSFHHIYYLLTNIFEYSIIWVNRYSGIVLNSFLHSYFFMNMYIHLLLPYSPIIILTLTYFLTILTEYTTWYTIYSLILYSYLIYYNYYYYYYSYFLYNYLFSLLLS